MGLGKYPKDWVKDSPIISKIRVIFGRCSTEFKLLIKEKAGDKLTDWCKIAIETGEESLKSFVNEIKKHEATNV